MRLPYERGPGTVQARSRSRGRAVRQGGSSQPDPPLKRKRSPGSRGRLQAAEAVEVRRRCPERTRGRRRGPAVPWTKAGQNTAVRSATSAGRGAAPPARAPWRRWPPRSPAAGTARRDGRHLDVDTPAGPRVHLRDARCPASSASGTRCPREGRRTMVRGPGYRRRSGWRYGSGLRQPAGRRPHPRRPVGSGRPAGPSRRGGRRAGYRVRAPGRELPGAWLRRAGAGTG